MFCASDVRATSARVTLEGHQPALVAKATPLDDPVASSAPLTLTIVLAREDQPGFDAFLRELHDPQSPRYRQYLSQAALAERFGPSRAAYDAVAAWLADAGFVTIAGSANRLTLTVEAPRAIVEQTFGVAVRDYRLGEKSFHAADGAPSVPAQLAPFVAAVIGLSNLAQPVRVKAQELIEEVAEAGESGEAVGPDNLAYTCWLATMTDLADTASLAQDMIAEAGKGSVAFSLSSLAPAVTLLRFMCAADELNMLNRLAAGLDPNPQSSAPRPAVTKDSLATRGASAAEKALAALGAGRGQKIGLVEFDNFTLSDVQDFLNLVGRGAQIAQLSQVHVAGGAGAPGPDQSEVLLDIDAVMSLAPGANVVVYDGPFAGRGSFQTMFNAMINDGVNVISNSWAYCEDQTSAADVQSIESILASAAASGITVVTGSGDSGSTCLDGAASVIAVPAGAPHITAVGGASSTRTIGGAYGGESWWGAAPTGVVNGGKGGFGTSRFFARPSYQDGLNASAMRSIPDLTAPADPRFGYLICQASAGGCPTNLLYGGTSVAAPIVAAMAAVLNQQSGAHQGFLNAKLYPLASTPSFHSAPELGSDFAHVGLGSPNFGVLYQTLTNTATGSIDFTKSALGAFPPVVTANGAAQAGVAIVLRDAGYNTVSGVTVQLFANGGSSAVITPLNATTSVANGAALFKVTDAVAEFVTFTAIVNGQQLSQHPTVQFITPPATSASIAASPTTVTANGNATTTITVTLQTDGQPAAGKLVSIGEAGASAVITAANAVTDANGQAHFTATDFAAETVTFTAVDVTDGNLPVPGNAGVSFVNETTVPCNTGTPTAGPGYAVTTFVGNVPFDNYGCLGPVGTAFSPNGDFYMSSNFSGDIYRFGPAGGTAGPGNLWSTAQRGASPSSLLFAPDGRLYSAQKNPTGRVVELDTATGQVTRIVVAIDSPLDMKVDPLSHDLFVSNFDGIQRVTNWTTGPGTATTFYSSLFTDGFAFASDGSVYVKTGCCPVAIVRLDGTDQPNPGTSTLVANVPAADGIGIEHNPAAPAKPFIYVNRNDGIVTRIDQSVSPATTTDIMTNGSRGDFVTVGPDGCFYATQADRVVKLTLANATCALEPTATAAQLTLSPSVANPAPTQGGTTTFSATLTGKPNPQGTPVRLMVTGANPGIYTSAADGNGVALFTYPGVHAGGDTLMALVQTSGAPISSNLATASWSAGSHRTVVSLPSPIAGRPHEPVALRAKVVDIAATPPAGVAGVQVEFSVGAGNCSAATDASGVAACAVTTQLAPGEYAATASFAGEGALLAANATATVFLMASPLLDIDGNGQYDALTDGLLLIRYLFGIRGTQLVVNAIGANATRSDPADIASYIADAGLGFDVDGNQQVDALTDGLITLRYLFGLRGASLVNGAIGGGATRTGSDIETYVQSLMP